MKKLIPAFVCLLSLFVLLSGTQTAFGSDTNTLTYTTAVTAKEHKTDIMNSILTGDRFPAHAIRLVMLLAAMTAIFAFLFKQKQSEEDEKNE